jgi:nucleotide-binding universal stress UspA family protein
MNIFNFGYCEGKMKNILCPTDFSETAQNAVTYAAKVAQKTGAQLTLFHAITFGEMVPNEFVWGRSITVDTAQNYIDELCLEIRRVYKISCEGEAQPSSRAVSQIISDEGGNFDIIIMGSDGPDNFYEYVAGSNTYQVAHEIQKPLLLIPAGTDYQDISTIVCAFDYLNNYRVEFHQLLTWAKLLHAPITMLQVLPEEEHRGESEKLKIRQFQLKKLFDNQVSVNFKTIRSAEVHEGILNYIDQNECDVMALGSMHYPLMKRLFHKSVTKALAATVKVPLFIFHH